MTSPTPMPAPSPAPTPTPTPSPTSTPAPSPSQLNLANDLRINQILQDSNIATRPDPMPLDTVMTALCVWEAMLERYKHSNESINPDPMSELWDNVGTYEMRHYATEIAPWVDETHTRLEIALGDDALAKLNLHAFDWEFVPLLLNFVVWDSFSIDLPPPEEVAARLVAAHALVPSK